MNYKYEYPIGKLIKSYPSHNGDFPAEVIGHRIEKNLNTQEVTPLLRLKVYGVTEDGERVVFFEDCDPNLLP